MQINTNSLRNLVFKDERFSKYSDLNENDLIEERKKNKELDWALYDADKAQMFMDLGKEKMIASKLARGEKLSDEEQKFLEKNNPQLMQKAQMALQQAQNFKQNMGNKEDTKMQVLSSIQTLSKYDPEYAELLLDAHNK